MSYVESLESALDVYSRTGRVAPVALHLGCRHMSFSESSRTWRLIHPEQPDAIFEPLVAETLRNLLVNAKVGSSLGMTVPLDGLCQNDRWRTCFASERDAYSLANALLLYAIADSQSYPDVLIRTIRNDVHAVLHAWLGLDVPDGRLLPVTDIVRAMFGSTWWDLIVSLDAAPKDDAGLLHLILATRPAFLPGLVPVQDALSSGMPLPQMPLISP